MSRRIFLASFDREEDIVGAAWAAREQGLEIVDAFTPYAVHDMDRAMGLRPSRLSWVCFGCGLFGVAFALAFQFWTMTRSWPMNVGGKPWNSLPAYVPITFEVMVLLAGLGVVFAFFLRSGLFPGKQAVMPGPEVTDNQFVLVLENDEAAMEANVARELLREFHAVRVEEKGIEELGRCPGES